MSSNLPPSGPPSGLPTGPPPSGPPPGWGPPSGPPSGPPTGPPEYLSAGGGDPLPGGRSGGGRRALVAGGAVVGLAAVGAGVWAAVSFFSTGAQPAEALPADTLGYVSIDLDPSGGQKIEALRTLKKFPAFEDEVGIDTDDDLRERLFSEIQGSGACKDLDYAADVEPWLGDRFAAAAIDRGEEGPAPVLVVQVRDADAADEGLAALRDCSVGAEEGDDSIGAWAIEGDWAVLAETQEIADDVSAAAADSPLSDDEDFQRWTGEAGDAGILSAYVAPEGAVVLAEELGGFGAPLTGTEDVPDEVSSALADFEGAALTVRFDDGSLEVETATGTEGFGLEGLLSSDGAAAAMETLPADTAAAFGLGFEEGWFDEVVDYAATLAGDEADVEELLATAEAETGLSLPEDAEALLGDSAALSVGSDLDPSAFFSGDLDLPIALKVRGDADEVSRVLDTLAGSVAEMDDETASFLDHESEGDFTVVGPSADYRADVLADGGLGDSDVFQDVVREADRAGVVLFVSFDAGDDWLARLAGDEEDLRENLDPLTGLGLSGWVDDGVGHAVLRVTTD